jgi:hypothetical protein
MHELKLVLLAYDGFRLQAKNGEFARIIQAGENENEEKYGNWKR